MLRDRRDHFELGAGCRANLLKHPMRTAAREPDQPAGDQPGGVPATRFHRENAGVETPNAQRMSWCSCRGVSVRMFTERALRVRAPTADGRRDFQAYELLSQQF